jgi:ketosteroid isomerase-like protein
MFTQGTLMKDFAKSLCVSLCFVLLGCDSVSLQPASTKAADEAAVRQTDDNWSKAAQSKKVDDWMAFYADDAIVLPPNEKKIDNKEGIRKEIGTMLAAPGLAIRWEPTKVEVARSGELAYTQGSYELTSNDVHGKPATDRGKTVEIWKKQSDGSWKCVVDMWSSDLPAPPV